MTLTFYNSLTRKKEVFKPLEEGFVGIYVCGPTVYGHSHLGHAKSYISFDIVVRYLRYLGNRVRYVQNITDVGHLTDDADEGEDKILRQAQQERIEPMEVVERYTQSYFEDMDALNILRPDISPRASGHIVEQIELIQELIHAEFAYEKNGSVYFNVPGYKKYGQLSGRKVADLTEGVRIKSNPDKAHPADFALWKKADPSHLMKWHSPWSEGYPGWHVECSVMSTKYLGEPFDIHGGGLENIFPHHESEIAQCDAAHHKGFAKYWMHNNMVTVNGMKMGKSLGNAISLKQIFLGNHPLLEQAYNPLTVRFFILSGHYRSPIDFTNEALQAAEKGLKRLHATVKLVRDQLLTAKDGTLRPNINELIKNTRNTFTTVMNDDFNTPQAIAALFDFNKGVNTLLNADTPLNQTDLIAIDELYRTLGEDVLGIIPNDLKADIGGDLVDGLIQILINLRQTARAHKDWATADIVRNQLADLGITLEDRPDGSIWKLTK